jgi:GT2 family glycosyltransferase
MESRKFEEMNDQLIRWETLAKEAPSRNQKLVSIIIPIFNQLAFTEQCVESIQSETHDADFEIVLVDNGSDPECHEGLSLLATRFSNVRMIRNPENLMFSLGNNVGVAHSHGAYLVFLNNDTKVTRGWLTNLLEPLRSDIEIGQVGSKLLYEDDTIQGAGFVFSDKSKIPYFLHARSPRAADFVNKQREYQAVSGACCGMRATDFVEVRGFDCGYINGCEDIDLGFKIRFELKKKILHVPSSEIYHFESKTEGRWIALEQNRARLLDKWHDKIVADDRNFYQEDGFVVVRYEKHGNVKDEDLAVYLPVVEKS